MRKEFQVNQKVLLFNSHLKLITGRLRSRWDGPLSLMFSLMVNGHQLKIFHEGLTPIVGEVESISLAESAISDDTP
ncbi:hypothetical protein CR513_05122, partial [Mucuna pruriens]